LTRDPNFLKFWTGQSISVFGSQFSGLAIPYAATFILGATAFQFGILATLGSIAFLLFSLHVGVWVDRHRRRVIMIYADIGRALMLALIPVSAVLGFLSINLFYLIATGTGILTVFFEIAYQSYVPTLVERPQIVDANGKLETSRAASSGFGPTIAGIAISVVSAPIAVIADTAGYLSSAGFLAWIRKPEPKVVRVNRSTWGDIRQGLGIVLGDRRLWQIAACTGTANLFSSALFAIIIPYLGRDLSMSSPLILGLVFSGSAFGSILGGLTSSRVAARLGVGRTIVLSAFIFGLPSVGIYFASGPIAPVALAATLFIVGIGVVLYNVTQVSYRQSLVPQELQGRMNATMRFIVTGAQPIGSFMGGVLGEAFGLHAAVGISIAGASLAFLWVLFSPVRNVRSFPTAPG
jgi:MFS family permease